MQKILEYPFWAGIIFIIVLIIIVKIRNQIKYKPGTGFTRDNLFHTGYTPFFITNSFLISTTLKGVNITYKFARVIEKEWKDYGLHVTVEYWE